MRRHYAVLPGLSMKRTAWRFSSQAPNPLTIADQPSTECRPERGRFESSQPASADVTTNTTTPTVTQTNCPASAAAGTPTISTAPQNRATDAVSASRTVRVRCLFLIPWRDYPEREASSARHLHSARDDGAHGQSKLTPASPRQSGSRESPHRGHGGPL